MSYDGLEIFKRRHEHQQASGSKEGQDKEERILNPKLKQCYEVENKIEPFYTGGKISVLSSSRFLAHCGDVVKLISTALATVKDEGDHGAGENGDGAEAAGEDGMEVDEAKPSTIKTKAFGVIATFEAEMDEVTTFDADASSEVLVTAHKSLLTRVWDLETFQVLNVVKSHHTTPITFLSIHRGLSQNKFLFPTLTKDGETQKELRNYLIWATIAGNVVKVWDGGGGAVSKNIKTEGVAIGFVKWEDTAEVRLFAADENIYFLELEEGDRRKEFHVRTVLRGHYSQVTGIVCGADNLMISGARDKTIIIWDKKYYTKKQLLAFPAPIEAMILLQKHLYIASETGITHMDIETYKLTSNALPSTEESIISFEKAANNPEEEFFITTHTNCIYQVHRSTIPGKKKVKKANIALEITKQYVGTLDEILAVAQWGDKVAVATNTSVIKIYDVEAGNCTFLRGHTDIVLTLAVQNEFLVSGSKDNRIIVWKGDSLAPHSILGGHLGSVSAICFHPDQPVIFSVADDNFLKMWDTEKCLNSVVAHDKEVHAVDCSKKGILVATASRDRSVKLWDGKTLKLKGTLKGHKKSVWDVKFSQWDQLIVTASADSTLKIWNIVSLECIQTLQGHTSSVLQARFFNSGLQIFSSSTDGTWKVWDIRNSISVATFESSEDKIWALDASADGSRVITGTADSILTVWKDTTQHKLKEATEKRKKLVEAEQSLKNLMSRGEIAKALILALELDRPFIILRIIRSTTTEDMDYMTSIIVGLSTEQKNQLLDYARKWNSNSRTSNVAQFVLNIIVRCNLRDKEMRWDVSSLLPYSKKHYERAERLLMYVNIAKWIANKNKMDGNGDFDMDY